MMRRGDTDRREPWLPGSRSEYVRRLLIAVALIVLLVFIWRIIDLLLLVFGAVLVAILLRAIADPLARATGLPAMLSIALTVVGLLVLIGISGWLFGAEVQAQLEGLSSRLPDAWRSLQARLQETEAGRQVLRWIESAVLGPATTAYAGRLVLSFTSGLAGLLVMLVGGVYLAAQPRLYRDGALLLVPRRARPAIGDTADKSTSALRQWLVGQLAIMVIVGGLTWLGAWLIGLPSAPALGLIAGLLEFIPFLGPILTAVPAMLLGLAEGPQTAMWTLVMLIVVQQVEGNVITPLVQRKAVKLPPALTLFALIAVGLVFGPLGLVLAAPLTVVAYVATRELYVGRTHHGGADPNADDGG